MAAVHCGHVRKGISTSSMSKVFSLAGVRLGWIATHDKDALKQFWSHRDYNLISCGMMDEAIAALALASKNQILERNKKSSGKIWISWITGFKKNPAFPT